jgi:hypothetical protein
MKCTVIQAEEDCSLPTARRAHTHHRFVRVLLELHESDPSHVLHLDIAIGTLEVVSAVEVRHQGRRCDPHGVFAVDFVRNYIVGLQQRLEIANR